MDRAVRARGSKRRQVAGQRTVRNSDPDPNADQGEHTFIYSLLPHTGDWRSEVIPSAYDLNDPLILRLAVVAGVSLVTLLWWQLSSRNEHPVIQLRVLKNRQLSASIFLFVVLGFGLFGGAILFPMFTQSILGFT